MEKLLIERMHIREVIENWVLWRDSGDWERFRTVWHPEGRMMATWFQGPAERFIEVSREGWNKDVRSALSAAREIAERVRLHRPS